MSTTIRAWQSERPNKRSMNRSATGMCVLSENLKFEHYTAEFDSIELAERAISLGRIEWVKAPSFSARKRDQRERNRNF